MSMMADMMADMLKKAMPPEVAAMLTPEKMKELGDKLVAFIEDVKGSQARIETAVSEMLASQERLEARIMEIQDNDGHNDKPASPRKRARSGSGAGSSGDE